MVWFGEIERKLAKLSMTTFTGTRQTEGKKLGLVWRNRKKTSQIINDYLYWDQANRGGKLGLVWRNKKKISQLASLGRGKEKGKTWLGLGK